MNDNDRAFESTIFGLSNGSLQSYKAKHSRVSESQSWSGESRVEAKDLQAKIDRDTILRLIRNLKDR